MGIKTEDFVKNIPSKELTENIDWHGILDAFDPTALDDRFLNECARRNPYVSAYKWEEEGLVPEPIEKRMDLLKSSMSYTRRELEDYVSRINTEGLTPSLYKHARTMLIKAIGEKGAEEYICRDYESLGEEGRREQAEAYARWSQDWERQRAIEKQVLAEGYASRGISYFAQDYDTSMHEKVVKVRKGVLGSNGKPLTQRDFAKYIEYPISKYVEAEKIDRYGRSNEPESPVEDVLLEKLVMICHTNPYWLFDCVADANYAEYDMNGAAGTGDVPCVFAAPDVILRWIKAGKPKVTNWEDGIVVSGFGLSFWSDTE